MTSKHIVIGTGAIAHAHAAAVIAQEGRGSLVHAIDVDAARAEEFAAKHDIARWGTDLAAALAERPDLAHVCTPPGTHVPLTVQCLEAGVPVLLEKPPVLSLAEMDELVAASERTGADVAVVFQHRFGRAARSIGALLAEGAYGRPLVATCDTLWFRAPAYFEVPWRGKWEVEGGGPTMGHGIHQFDLLLALLGPWSEVTAMAGRQARDTQTEDVSTALVRFENGAMATIVNSVVSPRETSTIRIDTERATIEVEHLYGYADRDWTITPAPGEEAVLDLWTPTEDTALSEHRFQVAALMEAMDRGEKLPVSLQDARVTMELVASIYASAFTGQVVRRGDIGPGHDFYDTMNGSGAPWA